MVNALITTTIDLPIPLGGDESAGAVAQGGPGVAIVEHVGERARSSRRIVGREQHAGFAMLEAGLVRAKNTAEILTKNVGLYSIACIMYMLCGYSIMYPGDVDGSVFASVGNLFGGLLGSADNTVDDVLASGGETYHSELSNFFFQVVFVATAMSIVSGAVAERMKLWSFFLFAVVLTGLFIPYRDSGSGAAAGWTNSASRTSPVPASCISAARRPHLPAF